MKTARTPDTGVEGYITGYPRAVQRVLKRVRAAIRKAVPDAQEMLSYNMPTYKIGGRPVIYFAAWKAHYSLYPANARIVAAFKDELAPYDVARGTIRFPLSDPVPATLIEGIARFRAREVAALGKPGAARSKKR